MMEKQNLTVTQLVKKNTPYNFNQTTKNDKVFENFNFGLHKIYQKPYIIPEIPKTHYLPLINTDFVNQRLSVIRFAKSKRDLCNDMDISIVESAPKRYKLNSSFNSQPASSPLPFNSKEVPEIPGNITPPASLVDFSANEAQNETDQMSPTTSVAPEDITILGPNKSAVLNSELQLLNLNSCGNATRGLLDLLFTFEELATHSLTGKPSPAFYGRERPKKRPLDSRKIEDIIDFVRKYTGATAREIRQIITAKCADSAKKYRKHFKN